MKLSNENIDKAVEEIRKFFENAKVTKRDLLKINLIAEESLLRWQEHFGEDKEFTLKTRQWFGTPKVVIRLQGTTFNPLDAHGVEGEIFSQEVMLNLLNYETAGTSYDYKNGCNEITIFSTKEKKPLKIPGGSITVAILLAIIFSLAVGQLPQDIQTFIIEKVTAPLLSTLMKLIVAVTIPTIFISVISSICIMDDIATLNDIGLKVIKRFMAIMLFVIVMSMVTCGILFPVISLDGDSNVLLGQIIELMLSVVSDSAFKPFIEGNVLQIVVIAFAAGACVVVLDKRIVNLKTTINDLKNLLFKIMEFTLKIIPLTIFLCVFKTISTMSLSSILIIWKVVLASYITYFGASALMLLYLKTRYKISIKEFFKLNAPVFIITTTTASGTISMMTNYDVCKKNLKIDPNLCDFWIPLSHTLFSPGTVNTLVVCSFMGAVTSSATISISQLLVIAFLAIQLSIVTPKVYGGNIASFTILLNQLGFSLDVIGTMMIADIFTVNLASLFGMVARNCELFDLSHKISFHSGVNDNEPQQ